jgi:hypothetical protein
MSCSSPVQTVTLADHKTLFSLGGSSPGVNRFIFEDPSYLQIAPLLSSLRTTLIVENASGGPTDFETQVSFQTTNDGNWSEPWRVIQAWGGGNRAVTSAPYTDVSNFGRGIRFSVECRQRDTVNTLLLGMVSVIVDFTVKS